MSNWGVYIILCKDDTLYTGITTDVVRRWSQHCKLTGAKYFRAHTPKEIVFFESGHSQSSAAKREISIKKMKKKHKLLLIQSACNKRTEQILSIEA